MMDELEREPVRGFGHQIGPIAERYGPDWAPLKCDVCSATWIGPIGEWCDYCTTRYETVVRGPTSKPATYEQLIAVFNAAGGNGHKPGDMAGDSELRTMLIDWPTFWAKEHSEAEWLAEPLIPAGRSVAIFAPGGTGKSLLALWLAVAIATGTPIFGRALKARRVLYLDYEMTEDDLAERLEAMGYGGMDLSNLHYALLPSLAGLDTKEGGQAVLRLAELVDAELVIIDTFGRAVHGDENEADTIRNWYRWTGLHLKQAGRAFARIDHAGKDLAKGQRGTSAKNDDVDVVWQMTVRDENSFTLTAKKRRMGWVPETVSLHLDDSDDLIYTITDEAGYVVGTTTCAGQLDDLGAPVDISGRTATQLLRDNNHPTRRQVILAALKYRRETALKLPGTTPGTTPPENPPGTSAGTFTEPKPNTLLDELGTITGTTGNRPSGQVGSGGWLPVGEPPDPSPNPVDPLEDF